MARKMRGLYEDKQFWEGKWAREEALEKEAAEEDSWLEREWRRILRQDRP